jgi:preprotein translocase subunit SecD
MRRNGLFSLIFIVLLSVGGIVWTLAADHEPLLGLDLQGGVSVVLQPTEDADDDALGQAIEIIRQRVDAIGVAEPEISRQGDAIVVQLPGVADRDRALELVGQTAELRFRPVLQQLDPGGDEEELSTGGAADEEVILAQVDDEGNETARYRLGPTEATGDILRGANAELFELGQWQVAVQVRGDRIDQFNDIASRCYNGSPECPTRQLAIELDGRVVSAPAINAPSFDPDQVSITGQFTEPEAKDLALVLRYGALPVELEAQQTRSVSASLGDDALDAGVIAGLIGLGLVTLYMVVYYRLLGVVAILSLLVAAALLWTMVAWLGESQGLALTLAGVTGVILSVGVAVDSNVVFYEHLKEEVSKGRTLRAAVDGSFASAFSTIVKADLASLIGAGVLYWLTVGPVRGFAFFLGLATLLDLVAAYFFMRPVTLMLVKSRRLQGSRALFGMPRPAHPDAPAARSVEEGVPA